MKNNYALVVIYPIFILILILISCKKTKFTNEINQTSISYPYDNYTDTVMKYIDMGGGLNNSTIRKWVHDTLDSDFNFIKSSDTTIKSNFIIYGIYRTGLRSIKYSDLFATMLVELSDSNISKGRLVFSDSKYPEELSNIEDLNSFRNTTTLTRFSYIKLSWIGTELRLRALLFYTDTFKNNGLNIISKFTYISDSSPMTLIPIPLK